MMISNLISFLHTKLNSLFFNISSFFWLLYDYNYIIKYIMKKKKKKNTIHIFIVLALLYIFFITQFITNFRSIQSYRA